MIGKDLSELENLIKRLEELRNLQIEKENKEEQTNESSQPINHIQNAISTSDTDNTLFGN